MNTEKREKGMLQRDWRQICGVYLSALLERFPFVSYCSHQLALCLSVFFLFSCREGTANLCFSSHLCQIVFLFRLSAPLTLTSAWVFGRLCLFCSDCSCTKLPSQLICIYIVSGTLKIVSWGFAGPARA